MKTGHSFGYSMRRYSLWVAVVAVLLLSLTVSWTAVDTPIAVDLKPASDSGVYDDDNITNVATGTIGIMAASAGNTIKVYEAGSLLGQAVSVGGVLYEYTFSEGELTEGNNVIVRSSFGAFSLSIDAVGVSGFISVGATIGDGGATCDKQHPYINSAPLTIDENHSVAPRGRGKSHLVGRKPARHMRQET